MRVIRAPIAFLTSRAGQFVLLAFLLAAQNTYVSTVVASRFLAAVGAEGIPLYYILYAVVSIPLAAFITGVIERLPRRRILVGALAIFTALTVALPMLPAMGAVRPYAAYLIVRVLEHLIYSVYYILIADYFSVTDSKRYAGRIALGMAVGGLIGGGLLTIVAAFGGPLAAALASPALVALALVYGGWVTRRHQPLDAAPPAASRESILDSLRILPPLVQRYPLIALMTAAMFLNVLLQCIAEFLAFSIYTIHFPQADQLAVFLGLVNAGLSVLGFVVIVLFTERALPRLGVPIMNRVYPALDVATFAVLTVTPSLPAGILANVSYDPFEHGIDVPVTTMNYNAIRHRFVGRVRVLIDGIIYPLGLASAGLLLLGVAARIDLRLVAAAGLMLSLLLLALHWQIGRQYALGLIEMLRDGAVELGEVEHGLRLSPEYVDEIRAMLASDPRTALVGLEMAVRCAGDIPPADIAAALAKIATPEARRVLGDFAASDIPARRATVEWLAENGAPEIRVLAWERMFSSGTAAPERARQLLGGGDDRIRAIAAAAVLADDPADEAAASLLCGPLSPAAAVAAVEVLRKITDPRIAAILSTIGEHSDPAVRAGALAAAAHHHAGNPVVLEWARRATGDPEPVARREALALLARGAPDGELAEVAGKCFADASAEVRHAAVQALGLRREAAVAGIRVHLQAEREEVQLAAIDALGAAIGPSASHLLFDELETSVFAQIPVNRRLALAYPKQLSGGPAIHAALDNADRRALRLVMHALDALGHHRTLNLVRTMLNSRDERTRANAIESLASLPQRRFVIPILPLIEDGGADPEPVLDKPDLDLLERALASRDAWLRAAAAVAWQAETGRIPDRLLHDRSPYVTDTVRQLLQRAAGTCPYPQEVLMSRLAFLHSIKLFAETGLDDLIAVDHALGSETYLAGEAIIHEGEAGDRLCIVYSGTVVVKKGEHVLARLGAGEFFGEMALFDNGPRSATVTAADHVEVLVLQRDRFHSLVRQRPAILTEFCATLVRRLRQAEQDAAATAVAP